MRHVAPLKRGTNSSQREEFHLVVAVFALRKLRPRFSGRNGISNAESFAVTAQAALAPRK